MTTDMDDWDDIYQVPETEPSTSSSSIHPPLPSSTIPQISSDSTVPSTSNPTFAPPSPHTHPRPQSLEKKEIVDDGIPAEAISTGDELIDEGSGGIGEIFTGKAGETTTTIAVEKEVLQDTTQISSDLPMIDAPPTTTTTSIEPSSISTTTSIKPTSTSTSNTTSIKPTSIKPTSNTTSDPEFLAAAAAQKGEKAAEWQFDSSDAEESSSDDDSDSDDSSNDEDAGSEDDYQMLDPAALAKILMSGDGEDDDAGGKSKNGGKVVDNAPRTANEVKEVEIIKPDIPISPEMKITFLGIVERVVENMALIKGATPGEYQVLESGSVLCNEEREVLGVVADTFGRVQEPLYSIAFTNSQSITDAGLEFGKKVYYVDEHSTFVFTQPLRGLKGTDASNIHDEEVAEHEAEFSDDEAEAEAKRARKQAKVAARGGSGGAVNGRGRGRGGGGGGGGGGGKGFGAVGHDSGGYTGDAPMQNYGGGMSYDDVDDDAAITGEEAQEFYSPLKRPENLSQLMAGGVPLPSSSSSSSSTTRGGFSRGGAESRERGGRGGGVDRGGRGRGGRGSDRGRGRGGRGGGGNDNINNQSRGGNAHSFPDRHNHSSATPQQSVVAHSLPSKPSVPQGALLETVPQGQGQGQQTYQFGGYQFQYGQAQVPQQQHLQQPQPQQMQIPPGGSYINPAFFGQQGFPHPQMQQQQQQVPQMGYNAQQSWSSGAGAAGYQPQPQQMQQGHQYAGYQQGWGQGQQQHQMRGGPGQVGGGQVPGNLADILKTLNGGIGNGAPPPPSSSG